MRLNAFFSAGLDLLSLSVLAQGQTLPSGQVDFGVFDPRVSSYAYAVSANGSMVVGDFYDGSNNDDFRAIRWTAATGMVNLGVLNDGAASTATSVSGDGNVVVGYSLDSVMSPVYRAAPAEKRAHRE